MTSKTNDRCLDTASNMSIYMPDLLKRKQAREILLILVTEGTKYDSGETASGGPLSVYASFAGRTIF